MLLTWRTSPGTPDLATDQYAPAWWVLADAESNEADVASWMGRN